METLRTFRHEFKYIIPYQDMLSLKSELEKVLILDQKGSYKVRSLYFDSINR